MRLLIVTPLYPPSIGGPATYTKLLEKELPFYNIETQICSFDSIRKYPKIISHIIFTAKIILQSRKSDIIYTLDPVSVGIPSLIASKITRKKLFLKMVGDYAWEQGTQRFGVDILLDDFIKSNPKRFLLKLLWNSERLVAKNADKVIVPSKYLSTIVRSWGVPENKIRVIYNSVELPTNIPDKNESRKNLGLTGKVFVSSGRLVPWKGFLCLIEAFLEAEIPESYLYIIGSGPQRTEIQTKIKDSEAEQRIILLDQLPQEKLFEYIVAADCFVLNTGYEGLSHQLLEVMSIGTPIVTTDVGGNPELISNNIEGLLVKYNDKKSLSKAMIQTINESNPDQIINAKKKASDFAKLSAVQGLIKEII